MSSVEAPTDSVVSLPRILVIRARSLMAGTPWIASVGSWAERVDISVSEIHEAPDQWALALSACREAARALRTLYGRQAAKVIRDSGCALVLARRSLTKAGVDLSVVFDGEEWKLK